MPEAVDEVHRVVFVDGIWVARGAVVLIACTERHVLSWHLARAETSAAWRSLLSRAAPPDVVVTDGGSGFAKAVAAEWPRTRVQRCVFRAFCQVKRCTTTRPKLQAGVELYALAKELLHMIPSMYFSPIAQTDRPRVRKRTFTNRANGPSPLPASRRPSSPAAGPSACTTCP